MMMNSVEGNSLAERFGETERSDLSRNPIKLVSWGSWLWTIISKSILATQISGGLRLVQFDGGNLWQKLIRVAVIVFKMKMICLFFGLGNLDHCNIFVFKFVEVDEFVSFLDFGTFVSGSDLRWLSSMLGVVLTRGKAAARNLHSIREHSLNSCKIYLSKLQFSIFLWIVNYICLKFEIYFIQSIYQSL